VIRISDSLFIPAGEVSFKASRSGGPGGQNVNKVSTRVTLSFDLEKSPSLPEDYKARIRKKLARRISKEGVLQVMSQKTRSQDLNRADAIRRFQVLLADAIRVDVPRIRTRVPSAEKETRLEMKKRKTAVKEARSKWRGDE
jgi:ribosome-associated protein